MSCQETLFRTLREKGMRVTPQREIVLSVLHDVEDHASVEEIYGRVQLHSSVMDISTVYRTLEMLGAMSMLDVLDGADGQRRYALRHTHHSHLHLVCSGCGVAIEADAGPVSALAAALPRGPRVRRGRASPHAVGPLRRVLRVGSRRAA